MKPSFAGIRAKRWPQRRGLCADEHALGAAAENAGGAEKPEAGDQDRQVLVNGRPEHRQVPRGGKAQKEQAPASRRRCAGQRHPIRKAPEPPKLSL